MPAVVVMNNKGGVGKTGVLIELAVAQARKGRRVLVVDMDPQANASRRLGFAEDPAAPVPTLAEAVKANERGCAADIVVRCGWADEVATRIDLLPSRFDLENRISEAGTVGAHLRLSKIMYGVGERYDWLLIDCPPSLGHLSQMAMVAAGQPRPTGRRGFVVIVAEPEFDAMTGAIRVRDFVGEYAAELGVPELRIGGVVVNKLRRTDLHGSNVKEIEAVFGTTVWEPYLPLWNALADAHNSAVPVHTLGDGKARDLAERFARLGDRLENV